MIFTETRLKGAFIIDIERREDDRGFFARAFCQKEFAEHGLKPVIAQANIAVQQDRRARCAGMHFQYPAGRRDASWCAARAGRSSTSSSTSAPRARPTSSTSPSSSTADNHRALYVPERFAHGYQVLEDGTETSYQVGEFYTPERRGRPALRRPAARLALAAAGRARSPPKDAAVESSSTRSKTSCKRRG